MFQQILAAVIAWIRHQIAATAGGAATWAAFVGPTTEPATPSDEVQATAIQVAYVLVSLYAFWEKVLKPLTRRWWREQQPGDTPPAADAKIAATK